jgi:hypothetical protein
MGVRPAALIALYQITVAVHVKLTWTRSALGAEDVAMTSHDFDGPDWDAAASTAVRGLVLEWWSQISERFTTATTLREMRVYNSSGT